MNTQFYIVIKGQAAGPFRLDELKTQKINRDTLVWSEGMTEWVKAENHPQLQDFVKTLPPPVPAQSVVAPPPIPKAADYSASLSNKYFGYELATRWQRFFAALIQSIIFTLIFSIFFGSEALSDIQDFSFQSLLMQSIAGAIMGVLIGAVFYPFWSGNLGHKILGLKVISSVDGSDYKNAGKGALREALKEALTPFIIPVLWILWDENKQALHDKIVNTYVVKKKMTSGCGGCLIKTFIIFFILFLALYSVLYFFTDGIKNFGDYVVEQLPPEFDAEIGKELHKQILSEYKEDKKGSVLLTEFFHELKLDNKTRVHVLKSNDFNAFAIPGNNIYIFSKVLEEIESPEELTALLVHEYAHIKYRHGMKNLAEALLRNLLVEIFFTEDKGLKTLVENANLLLTLENSREMEIESDLEAFRYFRDKKLDRKGLLDLYRRLEEIQQENPEDIPTYLSTHPDSRERYNMISDSLDANPYKAKEYENLNLKFDLIKSYLFAKYLYQLIH